MMLDNCKKTVIFDVLSNNNKEEFLKKILLLVCSLAILTACETKETETQEENQTQETIQEPVKEEPQVKQKKITDCEIIPDGSSAVSPRINLKNDKGEFRIVFRSTPDLKTIYSTYVGGNINGSDVVLSSKDGESLTLARTSFDADYHVSILKPEKYNNNEFEKLLNFDVDAISVKLLNGSKVEFKLSKEESDNFNCYLNKIYEY